MKIRFSDRTMRVRVGRTELERLATGESLKLELPFTPEPFVVSVEVTDVDGLNHFHAHLRVTLAQPTLQAWAAGQQERYPFNAPDASIHCHIERDFPCTTPKRDAPCEEDTFERPPSHAD